MLKVVELFAGIGSQTQALTNIGVPHEVVGISEIDKYAITSYEAMHGKANNFGDITKIESLPKADLWTFSFPCQDISVAGKQAGIKEGTRSGLLLEVERLIIRAKETNTLPKYLLLENVKNLVGKKFKADYDKWLAFLRSMGYTNYWQVLNAKHYGIPQNRERVFCVSICGEHPPFVFPEKQELKLRLRDLIDEVVDEKYYLSERALQGLQNTNFSISKGRLQQTDICRTLMARDHKDPSCIEVAHLSGDKWDKMHEISRRVYGLDGVAPTMHCCGGGNTEPKIVDDLYKGREPRIYTDSSPTIRSESATLKVIAGQYQPVDRDYNKKGERRKEQFECRQDSISNAVLTGDRKNCVKIVALRGRNDTDSADGTEKTTSQHLEVNDRGTSNALTTVQKDNLVLERGLVVKGYNAFTNEKGYFPEMYNPYNKTEIKNCAPTITTLCGTTTSSSSVLRADEQGFHAIRQDKISGKGADIKAVLPPPGMAKCFHVKERKCIMRIRKLTERECLRLMGWKDEQIDKIVESGVSRTQMYRQAGNGIVVQVLEAIFRNLFL